MKRSPKATFWLEDATAGYTLTRIFEQDTSFVYKLGDDVLLGRGNEKLYRIVAICKTEIGDMNYTVRIVSEAKKREKQQ